MILHKVKVYPSKTKYPKKKQLACKIAEIDSDNAKFYLGKNGTWFDAASTSHPTADINRKI